MPDRADGPPDDDRAPERRGEPAEPDLLPAAAPAQPGPRAQVALRGRGAGPLVREAVSRLARNPVAVTTALVGAGLAVRLAPTALGRDLVRAAPAALPAARSVVEPAVRHVVHHHVVHHVVHRTVHVVVHVRPAPPPGVL